MYTKQLEIAVGRSEYFKVFGTYSIEIENVGKGTLLLADEGSVPWSMVPGGLYLQSGRGIEIMFRADALRSGQGSVLKVVAQCLTYQPHVMLMPSRSIVAPAEKKCRCRAHSVKSTKHYDWCDLYNKESA